MPLNRTSCRQGGHADTRRSKERVGNRSTRQFLKRYLRAVRKVYGKLGGETSTRNLAAAERSARAKVASLAAAKKRTATPDGRAQGPPSAKRQQEMAKGHCRARLAGKLGTLR